MRRSVLRRRARRRRVSSISSAFRLEGFLRDREREEVEDEEDGGNTEEIEDSIKYEMTKAVNEKERKEKKKKRKERKAK